MANLFAPLRIESGNFDPNRKTLGQILYQFGDLADDQHTAVDTTPQLKFYNLTTVINDRRILKNFCNKLDAKIQVFIFEPDATAIGTPEVRPNLKKENYKNGVVWIYEPRVFDRSFKDPDYTEAWRIVHEIGHAIVEPFLISRYGKSYRLGRLGRFRKVDWADKPLKPASLKEAQRSVEWEDLAFRAQRMLFKEIGIELEDADYQREYNVNMADAIFRALTGEFGTPGAHGFIPDHVEVDFKSILLGLENAASQISQTDSNIAPDTKHLLSAGADLQRWAPVEDEDIERAIGVCLDNGISAVHNNWTRYGFYKLPSL